MTDSAQLLCNVLLKCDVSDAPGLASKLDGEDLAWPDIANAHDSGGEDVVHSLLSGLAKVVARTRIIQYLYTTQQNATRSSTGKSPRSSGSGSSSSSMR